MSFVRGVVVSAVFLTLLACLPASPADDKTPATILYNGKIFTAEPDQPFATASLFVVAKSSPLAICPKSKRRFRLPPSGSTFRAKSFSRLHRFSQPLDLRRPHAHLGRRL